MNCPLGTTQIYTGEICFRIDANAKFKRLQNTYTLDYSDLL